MNSEAIDKNSPEDRSLVIDKELAENKEQAKLVREDLRNHLRTLDQLSRVRVSQAKSKRESFDNHIKDEEKEVQRIHDDAYSTTHNDPEYENQINLSGIRKALLSVNKSEYSAEILGTSVTDEEKQTQDAVKALTKDMYQIRENRFELMELKKAQVNQPHQYRENKSSLIDDYADVSGNMPDYTGGDD